MFKNVFNWFIFKIHRKVSLTSSVNESDLKIKKYYEYIDVMIRWSYFN
jgi:hypothetical protein